MNNKENYTDKMRNVMEKYSEKISKIEDLLRDPTVNDRSALIYQRDTLKEKYKKGEKMLKEIEASTEAGFEKIKESAIEIFDEVKDAFHRFSDFLTVEHLYRAKDEIVDLGNDKIDDVQNLIKTRPLTAAACAVGVGFIIGAYLSRPK